ncbi:hypothetical protein V1505DRAFT_154564 [Lipomyces doorenjongii]
MQEPWFGFQGLLPSAPLPVLAVDDNSLPKADSERAFSQTLLVRLVRRCSRRKGFQEVIHYRIPHIVKCLSVLYETLMHFMPKARDGEIALGICLRDEDMERLIADEEFAKYGTNIG